MNSICFNNRKYANKFIEFILDFNGDPDNEYYFETHIYQEENLIIVEFDKVPYSGEWGGKFEYVDEDQTVATELILPDNSIELVKKGTEDDALNDWLQENPGWSKNSYGHWEYNKVEEL